MNQATEVNEASEVNQANEAIIDEFFIAINQTIDSGDANIVKSLFIKYKNILPKNYIVMANDIIFELTQEKFELISIN